jgi:hypothetical protein
MAGSSSTGPLKHRSYQVSERRAKSGADISWTNELDFCRRFYDFQEYDDTDIFTSITDSGASVDVASDAACGVLELTSDATTENDGASIQEAAETWRLSSTKSLWYQAKVKVADADEVDAFVGLAVAHSTNPEALAAAADRIGFQVDDGNASILCKSEKDGTETSTDSGVDLSDDTYVELGIYWNGAAAEFYVDGQKVATHTTNNPDDENMAISAYQISGSASGTQKMSIDYAGCCQER